MCAPPDASRDPFLAAGTTFSVKIDGFGMSHSMEEKLVMHRAMTSIPFAGRVDLKARAAGGRSGCALLHALNARSPAAQEPQHRFWVVEVGGPPTASLPSVRRRFYIGRQVGASERMEPLRTLELRNRRYLGAHPPVRHAAPVPGADSQRALCAGPTTMDHEMALIMCNMGLARRGALVFDPFVGTGSILLAAALRGALTMGTDIDLKVLREGKPDVHNGRKRSDDRVTVWSNFADAGLTPPLALLRADLAAPPFRGPDALSGWAHALICDPPYGVRAGGRKSGGRKPLSEQKPIPDHLREGHIPSTGFYPLEECMADLLETAAHSLVMHGRLVYFFPVALADDSDELLPRHPCLELVANCRQVLSTTFSRRLITMRKVREWYPAAKGEAHTEAQARAAAAPPAAPPDLDDKGGDANSLRKHRGKRT